MAPFKLLYICTGNTARSPVAEAFTRAYAEEHGVGDDYSVLSAGTHAVEGELARPEAISMAESFGLDLSAHKARQLTPEDVEWADLVLAMSWDQAAHIWSLVPGSWDRSFTVRELIHWSKQETGRPTILFPDKPARMRDRIEQAHSLRKRARADHGFWGGLRPQDLNVAEPDGRSDGAWRAYGQAMRTLVTDVVHLLGGP